MIAYLSGRVAAVLPGEVVVDVGGVGYAVQCTPGTLARLQPGASARVPTSLVVREDSMTLFGFADDDERDLFLLLQTASGVGPKVAQAMLAVHSPDQLRHAIATENLAALTQVSGIGRKGAQRIVLELKDRIGPAPAPESASASVTAAANEPWRAQVRDGLVGLGWSAREAEDAVAVVAADLAADSGSVIDLTASAADGGPDVAALMRAALRTLSRS